jgi:hypothetical protein
MGQRFALPSIRRDRGDERDDYGAAYTHRDSGDVSAGENEH